ncbi:hypothetical protein GmHk_02G003044 [Glycine max]|nr:hypothetical protein GmHk_02G003044 [Glycine max]
MANNFYNNAQFSKLYNSPDPKGCKLCNQVFTNTQALLTIRRLNSSPPQHVNSQIQLGSHQFPPPPTMDDIGIFQSQSQLMGMSQPISRNPFFNSNQIGSSSSSSSMPIRKMQVLPHAFPYVGNINGDGFKAFISNLEKPIKKIDFIDLVNVDDDNNSDVEVMDLDLKL